MKYANKGWLAMGVVFLLIALGEAGVFNPLVHMMDKHRDEARAANPQLANSDRLEAKQKEMERNASELPLGEQLDLMIAARKSKADTTKTASLRMGGQEDAPLVNYVVLNWMKEHRISRMNLKQLVFKIERAGRPSIGQLKRYLAVARDCSYEEEAGPDYNHGLESCMEYARLMNGKAHERVSPMFATANEHY